jgi:transposase
MPRAVPLPLRQVIFRRLQLHHHPEDIAGDLGLNPQTVRKLVRRFRRRGADALAPDYGRCGSHQTRAAAADLVEAALAMRRGHAGWGAGLIRVLLAEQFPRRPVASERTLQRHLARAGLNPAPAGRRPGAPQDRATEPHQVWQVDAAERLTLADGTQASWVRIVDEYTGAFLQTAVFPPGDLEQRPPPGDASGAAPGLRGLGPARAAAGG